MLLVIHSDEGYLNEKNARSCTNCNHFLTNCGPYCPDSKIVMSLAAEREATIEQMILTALGNPQPCTTITIDNTTEEGVINHSI